MLKTFLLIFLTVPITGSAQFDFRKPQIELIGTKIDTIHLTDFLLNEPLDKNFDTKFKVLEFWATWCKPCLRAVPHLNKLQQKYKDSNIVFISITDEPYQKVARTFEKVRFETIVATDTTRTIHRQLRIEYNGFMPLPQTVLIDDENKIVWYGNPDKLNTKLIGRFLTKKAL